MLCGGHGVLGTSSHVLWGCSVGLSYLVRMAWKIGSKPAFQGYLCTLGLTLTRPIPQSPRPSSHMIHSGPVGWPSVLYPGSHLPWTQAVASRWASAHSSVQEGRTWSVLPSTILALKTYSPMVQLAVLLPSWVVVLKQDWTSVFHKLVCDSGLNFSFPLCLCLYLSFVCMFLSLPSRSLNVLISFARQRRCQAGYKLCVG